MHSNHKQPLPFGFPIMPLRERPERRTPAEPAPPKQRTLNTCLPSGSSLAMVENCLWEQKQAYQDTHTHKYLTH